MVVIGILAHEEKRQDRFVGSVRQIELTNRINTYVDDPNAHFIFSDEHPIIARHLNGHQYRNCVVYHLHDSPKHEIGKYRNKGGFTSYHEIDAAIKEDANVIIDISNF